MLQPSEQVVARVRQVVEAAAAAPLKASRAELAVGWLADHHEHAEYDCPIVTLTPSAPDAARIVIEVLDDDLWWVHVADGPGTEMYAGMKADRYERLGSLVGAVVAGRYHHGPCTQVTRRLFRRPRHLAGWYETYETDAGSITSRHFGGETPAGERRFQPY